MRFHLLKFLIFTQVVILSCLLLYPETMVDARCDHLKYNMCKQFVPFNEKQVDCKAENADATVRAYCLDKHPSASTEEDCCVQDNAYCCGPHLLVQNQGVEGPGDDVDDGGDGSSEPTEAGGDGSPEPTEA